VSDPGVAFHTAQEAALRASAELQSVYSVVPTNQLFPFIRIGDDQILDDSDECQDGSEIIARVHVFASPEPPQAQQVRTIASAIRAALRADLGIVDHETILYEFVDTQHLSEPDGTSHAVLTFRYLTTPL
jgi:hypothetical protein